MAVFNNRIDSNSLPGFMVDKWVKSVGNCQPCAFDCEKPDRPNWNEFLSSDCF